jgi:hypothetical protein
MLAGRVTTLHIFAIDENGLIVYQGALTIRAWAAGADGGYLDAALDALRRRRCA